MTWNPEKARKILDASHTATFCRSVKKISGFQFESDRELVLLEENKNKVTLYVAVAPHNMPDVEVQEEYFPSSSKSGRHADIEAVSRSLGYDHTAYRVHIKSEKALECFIHWYQYA